jgi:hypothetical protein
MYPGCVALAETKSKYCAVHRYEQAQPAHQPSSPDFAIERDEDGLPIRLWVGTQKPETK